MFNKILISIALFVGLVACSTNITGHYDANHAVYVKQNEELIYCTSKNNLPAELLYYKSEQVEYKSTIPTPVTFHTFYITDVLGKVYSINSDEVVNYTCSKVVVE
jgi:hypothetical protein